MPAIKGSSAYLATVQTIVVDSEVSISHRDLQAFIETYKYRLHHEVEVSTGFTHQGPEARGCVNCVETEPSDVTDLYHGLRGPDNVSTA